MPLKLPIVFSSALLVARCVDTQTHDSGIAVAASPLMGGHVGITPRNQIVPRIDAHQHMMGPAALSTLERASSPPSVKVPPVLADLLTARNKGVDQESYIKLFAPEAQVYAEEQGRWWTEQSAILDALVSFGNSLQFVPTSYGLDGQSGYVAGVLRNASGVDTHNFLLGLKKGAGRWRIGSEMKQPIAPPMMGTTIVTAAKTIEVLDDAGIKYATVLSTAYWFGDPEKKIKDRWAGTRAENDWVIAETKKYPDRLIPFCGVNPIDDYAIAELERCAALGVRGLKIHRNSKFRTSNPQHVEKLKQFFRAANKRGMAIVLHVRDLPDVLIEQILPEAPDIPIQIAHMGSGTLPIFADAIAAGKPGTKNLWFDWTNALPVEDLWMHGRQAMGRIGGPLEPGEREEMAALMRKVGLGRILYGSDMPLAWNPTPREWWRKTILTLPLTDDEIRDIADNLPPYVL